tara:strand:- start:463 stop:633 length:171 start_codon:yes stop_codon:yes gene_type:complete
MNSPCLRICKLDENRKNCTACLRTIYEIENWINFSTKKKKKVIEDLKKRKGKKNED